MSSITVGTNGKKYTMNEKEHKVKYSVFYMMRLEQEYLYIKCMILFAISFTTGTDTAFPAKEYNLLADRFGNW